MNKTTNDYKRKSVTFDTESKDDMDLFRELQKLPHGEFSRVTKEMWHRELELRRKAEKMIRMN